MDFADETKVACEAADEAKWVDRRNASRVQVRPRERERERERERLEEEGMRREE